MRLLTATTLLAAATLAPSLVVAQDPPRTEASSQPAETKIMIGSSTIRLRATADGFIDATLTAPAATLFDVLTNAYEDVGLKSKELDPPRMQTSTGTYRAQYRIGKGRMSTFLDCGLDPMGLKQADSFAISMRVTTQVVPESADRATVRTLVQATGRPASNSGIENHCASTGKLEERIAEAVAKRAAALH